MVHLDVDDAVFNANVRVQELEIDIDQIVMIDRKDGFNSWIRNEELIVLIQSKIELQLDRTADVQRWHSTAGKVDSEPVVSELEVTQIPGLR